jgi:hypothetical protein
MGAHPYCYLEPFQSDINAAMQSLRQREFEAGRYDSALGELDPPLYMFEMSFPPDANSPAPGPIHDTIDEAVEETADQGTGGILDLVFVSDVPHICAVSPVDESVLRDLFGTIKPSREQITKIFPGPHLDPQALDLFGRRLAAAKADIS